LQNTLIELFRGEGANDIEIGCINNLHRVNVFIIENLYAAPCGDIDVIDMDTEDPSLEGATLMVDRYTLSFEENEIIE
jgi:hypothetical protein